MKTRAAMMALAASALIGLSACSGETPSLKAVAASQVSEVTGSGAVISGSSNSAISEENALNAEKEKRRQQISLAR